MLPKVGQAISFLGPCRSNTTVFGRAMLNPALTFKIDKIRGAFFAKSYPYRVWIHRFMVRLRQKCYGY